MRRGDEIKQNSSVCLWPLEQQESFVVMVSAEHRFAVGISWDLENLNCGYKHSNWISFFIKKICITNFLQIT